MKAEQGLSEKGKPEPCASERVYRHLFEGGKDGILVLDADSRKITDANPMMTELLAYAREEFIGKELWELGLMKDEASSKSAFRELQEKNFVRYDDLPLQTKDGRTMEVELVSHRCQEGERCIIQCHIRDVTKRKRLERELAEKARLLDLSNDAIIVRGLDDKISLWNHGAEKLYGWAAGEVMGKHLHTLVQTEFPKPLEEIVAQLYREGQLTGEVIHIARDGRRVPSLGRWVLDQDTKNILTSYTDISDRKQAEAKLESSLKERTDSLQALESLNLAIAHDLGAPIRAIRGFSAALMQDAKMDEEGKGYARRIQNTAQRMSDLVSDLLKYSKLGHQEITLDVVDLKALVENLILEQATDIQTAKAAIRVDEPLPVVLGNETLVEEAVCNLLVNALKFIPPGVAPQIRIWAEEKKTEPALADSPAKIRLWVQDNGIGIAPQDQEKIFNVFQR